MNLRYTTHLTKHDAVTEEQIVEICTLKAIRWDYSLDQHREWIEKNLNVDDYHLLIYSNTELIAYTNFVTVTAVINGEDVSVKGIGNVCTRETGKGYGNILMDEVNNTLTKQSWRGLLICKKHLISYYEKFKWLLVDAAIISNRKELTINYMTYNFDSRFYRFDYFDQNF